MTKHLRLLIVSGLIFSFIYPNTNTIYFTEEVNGEIVDRVVKDVEYLGIKDSKVYYTFQESSFDKFLGKHPNVGIINCKDVYQIVDNDDEILYVDIFEVMEFSCSDSTFNPKLLISENTLRKQQGNEKVLVLMALSGVAGAIIFIPVGFVLLMDFIWWLVRL